MLKVTIPGMTEIHLEHLVLDYNGTLAVDGIPLPGVLEKLAELSQLLQVHILTADTHGSVRAHVQNEAIQVVVLAEANQPEQKKRYVNRLGASQTAAVGNGYNDHLMLRDAALGIVVLEKEGLSSTALLNADLLFSSILDALDSLHHPLRLTASLRR